MQDSLDLPEYSQNIHSKINGYSTKYPAPLRMRGDNVVIPLGLEPKTVCLEGRCSIRLSYGTGSKAVQRCKIEMHYLS